MNSSIKRFLQHALFWLAFFSLYVKLGLAIHSDWVAVLEIYFGKIVVQAIAAYVLVYVFIPKYLNKNKLLYFLIALLIWSFVIYVIMVVSRAAYLEPKFHMFFKLSYNKITNLNRSALDRIFNLNEYLDAVPWLFTPAAFMGLIKFYRNQLTISKIENEKRKLELSALKNQLNPHFLFNTLNNLYTLTIKKDDKAIKLIEKLSEILDYVLYRCNENKVSIYKEVELLENYIMLERIRYGESRLSILFNKEIEGDHLVPPLIFMTLLENAFKHGVINEVHQATISIHISCAKKQLYFDLENTKPNISINGTTKKIGIGLVNIKKQLDLLYAKNYNLDVYESENKFKVKLAVYEL